VCKKTIPAGVKCIIVVPDGVPDVGIVKGMGFHEDCYPFWKTLEKWKGKIIGEAPVS